jgi:hypothetical protein
MSARTLYRKLVEWHTAAVTGAITDVRKLELHHA